MSAARPTLEPRLTNSFQEIASSVDTSVSRLEETCARLRNQNERYAIYNPDDTRDSLLAVATALVEQLEAWQCIPEWVVKTRREIELLPSSQKTPIEKLSEAERIARDVVGQISWHAPEKTHELRLAIEEVHGLAHAIRRYVARTAVQR